MQEHAANDVMAIRDEIDLDVDTLADHSLRGIPTTVDLGPHRQDDDARRR
jgi:hypothetical protein